MSYSDASAPPCVKCSVMSAQPNETIEACRARVKSLPRGTTFGGLCDGCWSEFTRPEKRRIIRAWQKRNK